MIFLYDKIYNACYENRDYLRSIGVKWDNTKKTWYYNYNIAEKVEKMIQGLGIGIDNPLDRISDEFKEKVKNIQKEPFWKFKMTEKIKEIDFRKNGNVLCISDRDGYNFSVIKIMGDTIKSQHYNRHNFIMSIQKHILENPIMKIVFHHDFFDRVPEYNKISTVTDTKMNILHYVPMKHPKLKPAFKVESRVEVVESSSFSSTTLKLLPVAGTIIKLRLLNTNEIGKKFWEGAVYKNKEWMKREVGARWDGKNWWISKVPSEEKQKNLIKKGIKIEIMD